jgi:multicomponent K+:H+ antiporter subunit D
MYTLAFGANAGDAAWLAGSWLLPAALATLVIGMFGVLGSRRLGQMASFAVMASMGTLLISVSLFTPQSMSAALYYMIHSTLSAGAMFLIVDLITQRRLGPGDALTVAPRFSQAGLIAPLFFLAAIAMTGMPPLSGFIGKLLILDGARDTPYMSWIWSLVLGTSLLSIVGFARGGSTLFWKSESLEGVLKSKRRRSGLQFVAVSALLAGTVCLTLFAGPITSYLDQTAAQLFAPAGYVDAVLKTAERDV